MSGNSLRSGGPGELAQFHGKRPLTSVPVRSWPGTIRLGQPGSRPASWVAGQYTPIIKLYTLAVAGKKSNLCPLRHRRSRMSAKDSIGLIVSLFALMVSLTTAYYNIFRVNIHASIILKDDYPNLVFEKGGITSGSYDPSLTFVNDGNRPIVVLDLAWWIYGVHHVDYKRRNCDFGQGESFGGIGIPSSQGSFSPLVVDPNKIAVVSVKFEASRSERKPTLVMVGDDPSLLVSAQDSSGVLNIASCLEVRFTTPEGTVRRLVRPVSLAQGETRGENEGGAQQSGGPFFDGVPIDLMSDTPIGISAHSSQIGPVTTKLCRSAKDASDAETGLHPVQIWTEGAFRQD